MVAEFICRLKENICGLPIDIWMYQAIQFGDKLHSMNKPLQTPIISPERMNHLAKVALTDALNIALATEDYLLAQKLSDALCDVKIIESITSNK